MFYCEKEGSFGLKSQCFTTKKGFILDWKVHGLSWKRDCFELKSQRFPQKRGTFSNWRTRMGIPISSEWGCDIGLQPLQVTGLITTAYIKLACDWWREWPIMVNWCVEWHVLLDYFPSLTYHCKWLCWYTITCSSVKHNGWTQTKFNYCSTPYECTCHAHRPRFTGSLFTFCKFMHF